jgi:hypothetical protein
MAEKVHFVAAVVVDVADELELLRTECKRDSHFRDLHEALVASRGDSSLMRQNLKKIIPMYE